MVLKNPSEYEKGKTIIYFVRHGDRLETSDNTRIPGPGLSARGRLQAKHIAKEFYPLRNEIDTIYTSSMLRAQETAREIAKLLKKKIMIIPEFSELNKFVWERRLYHQKFWKHYWKYLVAKRRFNTLLRKERGKAIIIVAHGNVMKGIIGNKLCVGFKNRGLMQYDTCSITKMRFSDTHFDYLEYYNSMIVR